MLHQRQDRPGHWTRAAMALTSMVLLASLSGCAGTMAHPGPGYFQSKRVYREEPLGVSLGEPGRQVANRTPLSHRQQSHARPENARPVVVRGQQPASDTMYQSAWGEPRQGAPAGYPGAAPQRQSYQSIPGGQRAAPQPMQAYDATNAGGSMFNSGGNVQAAYEFAGPPAPSVTPGNTGAQQRQYQGAPPPRQPGNPGANNQGAPVENLPPPQFYTPSENPNLTPAQQPFYPPSVVSESQLLRPDGTPVDLNVNVGETRTGRFQFGVGVNSDAGLTGQIVIDERNFDITRVPTSFQDWVNGTAFRGAGQGFRVEAAPGSQVQRYLVNFTEPYLFDTRVSFNVSGYYYERFFFDWDEQRIGGRLGLGYSLAPDLSVNAALRMENVNLSNPRVSTVGELNEALGDSALYTGRVSVSHDTRDSAFAATEGYLLELAYEQGFGDFIYPRAEIDYRRYFLLRERADGSGRHTFAANFRLGFSGSDTPIYENYFSGGYSTLRGFEFRGASPEVDGVQVGGEFRFLGSAEYMFPLTADDMIKGVAFVDYGTTERSIELDAENFRVAPGFGLRVSVPAMGPAPIALDFAFPVAMAETDDKQVFSFFVGFGR